MAALENANPLVFEKAKERERTADEDDDDVVDPIDDREVFDENIEIPNEPFSDGKNTSDLRTIDFLRDLIRTLNDPEHPLTLEELNVVENSKVYVNDKENEVKIQFTPTIPHCSMATLIGLSIQVKLLRALPSRFKVDVKITPGTHASEHAVNKQLGDKERVAAALENSHLLEVVNQCLTPRT